MWVDEVRIWEKVTDTMLDPFPVDPFEARDALTFSALHQWMHSAARRPKPYIIGPSTRQRKFNGFSSSDDTAILPSYHVLASLSLSLYITITTMIKLKKAHNDPISCGHPHTFASTRSSCCASMLWCQLQHQGTAPWRNMKKSKKKHWKIGFKKRPPSCDSWDTPTLVLTQQLDCLVSKPSAEKSKDVTLKFYLCLKIEIPILCHVSWFVLCGMQPY